MRSVEIGLAHGVSTLSILGALAANGCGHHYVIDPHQQAYGSCGETMIDRAGLSGFHTFFERHPEEVIPTLPRVQFAFIDSSHLFDETILEFVLIDKKLEVGGIIGLHDLCMPAIQSVIRFILANRAYQIYREMSPPVPPLSLTQKAKQFIGQQLGKNGLARRFLSPTLFQPWSIYRLYNQNMIFLKKLAEDDRDWRYYQAF